AGTEGRRANELGARAAGREYHVARRQPSHVETVGVVPPLVERARREHREGAPDRDPRAERPAEAPERDAGGLLLHGCGERGPEDEPAARRAGEYAAQVDREVGRRP